MAHLHPMSQLGCWDGHFVHSLTLERHRDHFWCIIQLEPIRGRLRSCSDCGASTATIHDLAEQRVRDLPLSEHRVELRLPRVRVDRANVLRDDPHGRQVVKGAHWLLLKNRDSTHRAETVQHDELLAAIHDLFVVYVLRVQKRGVLLLQMPRRFPRSWDMHQKKAGRAPAKRVVSVEGGVARFPRGKRAGPDHHSRVD